MKLCSYSSNLTTQNSSLNLDYDGSSLTTPYTVNNDPSKQYLSVDGGDVILTVHSSTTGFTFAEDGTLEFNGSADGFEACKNRDDPYSYSKTNYAIVLGSASGDCVPIKLYKNGGESSSSSSSSEAASSTTSSEAVSSTTSSAVASSSTVSSYVVTVSGGVKILYTTIPCPAETTPAPAPVSPKYSNSTTTVNTSVKPTTITYEASSTVVTSCYTDSNGQVITKTVTEPCPASTVTSTPSVPQETSQPSKTEESTTAPKKEESSATTVSTVSTGAASTQPSIILAEGAAADFKPQGAFALTAGLVAALLI
ncbi:unnamed protein product [Ambrosiozyma monospora]|uniref:Unnamed protein product n=1 Tax=Ambrosiozyma monospora TaxID=43982 RepID=A0ACB5T266_AMBMO|nr:unnamed protein product [Ambrosiozyma monospora]